MTAHRRWFREERTVHDRLVTATAMQRRHQRLIRASRALFFARVGLAKGDLAFGLSRLAESCLIAPLDTVHITARRLRHRAGRDRRDAIEAWDAAAQDAR